ncbi:MAG TPA: hypothetical protein VFD37_05265, partial [Solirubrobacterales bacterium]|nr:hypothetical protein [Solirubrobacterales bacterium]
MISAVAIAFVYLYVVPQLESSLTGQALDAIAERAESQVPELEQALTAASVPGAETDPAEIEELVDTTASATGSRVTLLAVRGFEGTGTGPPTALVLEDSEERESLSTDSTEIANRAAEGELASGTGVGATGRRAEVAIPIGGNGDDPAWVA